MFSCGAAAWLAPSAVGVRDCDEGCRYCGLGLDGKLKGAGAADDGKFGCTPGPDIGATPLPLCPPFGADEFEVGATFASALVGGGDACAAAASCALPAAERGPPRYTSIKRC